MGIEYKELSMDDVMHFGKHEGKTVEEVAEKDPHYLKWCISKDVIGVDVEVSDALESK
ncbi:hypothetical protein KAR91_77205 [Candidatus Pacearchaeota archaeon]|nr:hypothetical protein [Candidatus Pacearchaeota archaeon]